MVIDKRSSIKTGSFWNVHLNDIRQTYKKDDVVDELDELIRIAVKKRLEADVPIGAFLSGAWIQALS